MNYVYQTHPPAQPPNPFEARAAQLRTALKPRRRWLKVSTWVASFLVVFALLAPSGYVVESPGPIFNTLGAQDGKPVIQIDGAKTYPTDGKLNLVTVYAGGGPASSINGLGTLASWLDASRAVMPADFMYPPNMSADQVTQQNTADMTNSQDSAVAAALTYLKIPVKEKLTVAGVQSGAAAAGKVHDDDVLVALDGKPIQGLDQLREGLDTAQGKEQTLTVSSGGKQREVTVAARKGAQGQYQLGVQLAQKFDFPFKVKFALDNVGGPSAGMMFALGIIDKLTPEDLTGGKNFAGTGTISSDGKVGPIGGIDQKMIGSKRQGAAYFLAPEANCDEVVGHIPKGLSVVKVSTLTEAVDDVKAIAHGTDPATLPQCTR